MVATVNTNRNVCTLWKFLRWHSTFYQSRGEFYGCRAWSQQTIPQEDGNRTFFSFLFAISGI